jgi:26S proteasome regulatory subunit N3
MVQVDVVVETNGLEGAARRLERLLGGKSLGIISQHHVNPSKAVRRWLGTSSGAAKSCTMADVSRAASVLLDPMGSSATGRDLLVQQQGMVEDSSSSTGVYVCSSASREVESWLLSLAVRLLYSEKQYSEAFELCGKALTIVQVHLEEEFRQVGGAAGSLYPLLARLYRYQGLVHEHLPSTSTTSVRTAWMEAHRMACLRRDVDTSATLLNLLLRNLLQSDQVEQAHKLMTHSDFPSETSSNNQLCRYLYHSGRIQALRLEYTSAFTNLSECLRKAPSNTGLGFRISCQKLLVVVQLLMGEIPDRSVFFQTQMVKQLEPYCQITQAVRRGDLAVFHNTIQKYADRLKNDQTYTLISRLAHSVVKAGLRKLNMSYSRISLQDVATRLGLASATSAEFVVAKAVRDGVMDATINHAQGYVQSHDLLDVYTTTEPAEAFHRRIAYCLTTHNDAVRAMRYPPDAYKKQLEASRGLRGSNTDDKTDEEKAQELEDELDEDY